MSDSIGNKIKKLRTDAGLSLAELAQQAGITVSQLEKIEDHTLNPSISVMIRISRILGTRLGTLLDGVESSEPVICTPTNHTPTVHVTNPENNQSSNLDFYSLAQQKSDRNMEPFVVSVGYSTAQQSEFSHHEGEEFIYVLSGSVTLNYGGKIYSLSQGSSMYYDSIIPHNLSSAKDGETAQILAVTYTPF